MTTSTIIGIAVGALFLGYVIALVNSLVRKRNDVRYAFSSIDALLKKRYDLIPNLIETVKQYMSYEKGLLNQVTELRTKAIAGGISPVEKAGLDDQLGAIVKRIILTAENYPDLKAGSNFLQLQAALNEVEEQISAARRAFSAGVAEYNNAVQTFPSRLAAKAMGYKELAFFETADSEKAVPDIRGLFKGE